MIDTASVTIDGNRAAFGVNPVTQNGLNPTNGAEMVNVYKFDRNSLGSGIFESLHPPRSRVDHGIRDLYLLG